VLQENKRAEAETAHVAGKICVTEVAGKNAVLSSPTLAFFDTTSMRGISIQHNPRSDDSGGMRIRLPTACSAAAWLPLWRAVGQTPRPPRNPYRAVGANREKSEP
jgi:hypothetical protein